METNNSPLLLKEHNYNENVTKISSNRRNSEEVNKINDTPAPAPGKRAWFTLGVTFLTNTFVGMNSMTLPVMYVYFTEYFETSKATAGWIHSIQCGMAQCLAIFLSPVVSSFGCKVAVFMGAIIVSTSIFVSAFTPNIWMLFFTLGFMPGFGLSLMYLSTPVIIQKQFNKHRNIATGISLIGFCLGNMIGPMVTEALVSIYGWRGACILSAAIFSHTTIFSLLLPSKRNEYHQQETDSSQAKIAEYDAKVNGVHITEDSEKVFVDKIHTKECQRLKTYFKHLCDFSLFKTTSFLLFCIAYMLLMFNAVAFWAHLIGRAISYHVARSKAPLLLSCSSLAVVISRLLCSIIANFKCSNPLVIFTCGSLVGGLSSFALTFTTTFQGMLIMAAAFGCHLGFTYTVATVSAVFLIGVHKIARAQAFLNFFMGLSLLISVPFTGWLFDITQNYNIPFYVSGSLPLLGSVFSLTAYLLKICSHRNREGKLKSGASKKSASD